MHHYSTRKRVRRRSEKRKEYTVCVFTGREISVFRFFRYWVLFPPSPSLSISLGLAVFLLLSIHRFFNIFLGLWSSGRRSIGLPDFVVPLRFAFPDRRRSICLIALLAIKFLFWSLLLFPYFFFSVANDLTPLQTRVHILCV